MYEAFYRLRAKPFSLNPDPRFFFGSKGHKRAMAYLEYGLSLKEGFIVITGEIGAGKTMLVRNLFKKLEHEDVVAAQIVSTQLDADDMLRSVAGAFGLEQEGLNKASLLKKLESYLLSVHRQGKRALLVVDEAQNLSPRAVEELRMLSNFQHGNEPLLQSFLLGQPEFRATLQSEELQQLKQRVIASYHLSAMDAAETRAYIQHRLDLVGWQGDPSISDAAYQLIHEFTGGIPRRINTLCDRLMLLGFLAEKHHFDRAEVQEVIDDLSQEVVYSTAPVKPKPGLAAVPAAQGAPGLEERIEGIERSLNRLLAMMRKLLHTLGEDKAGERISHG
ncbi:XrtA/PEP-CTERM system-associated ATPase [Thiobacter aerophilum]|uniref:XrtA/PEP-CTERM system-associated ATPase n=1 Tax=Thiobacter aerophilum TaxID=3121275 RepID=A0ABV0EDI3_9BURK